MNELKINYHYLNQCDMNCSFCFGKMNESFCEKRVVETFESLIKLTTTINLAGGEIFLYLDLLRKLVSIGVKNNIQLSLITNGYILTNKLGDERVDYIIRNVKMIGVSIDSFNNDTNEAIGRATNSKLVTVDGMVELSKLCKKYRTKLKINTVISSLNNNQTIVSEINKINPTKWKVIQVSTNDDGISVSRELFDLYCNRNHHSSMVVEYNDSIEKSYIMFNNDGVLFHGRKHYKKINVNEVVERFSRHPASNFKRILNENNIDISNYYARYDNQEVNLLFNKRCFSRFSKNKFNGNTLFLDVESISIEGKRLNKYRHLSNNQVHLLYTGLVVNNSFEISDQVFDHIPIGVNLNKELNDNSSKVFNDFYSNFFLTLRKYRIRNIVVSGVDTERNFLQDCLYYLSSSGDFSRKDYEYLQKLLNNLTDVQLIKRNGIIKTGTNKSASRTILEEIKNFRNDLFYYFRKYQKDTTSSSYICDQLITIYVEKYDGSKKLLNMLVSEIREYCMDDVYDDFELMYSYMTLQNSSVYKQSIQEVVYGS